MLRLNCPFCGLRDHHDDHADHKMDSLISAFHMFLFTVLHLPNVILGKGHVRIHLFGGPAHIYQALTGC